MSAVVNAKVGPLKAKFNGKVTLSNMNPPNSYTLSGEGQGAGGVGFAKGSVDIKLTEDAGETVLAYSVSAQVGGKLAQIGSRLIDSVAQQQAKQFFAAFVGHFEVPEEAVPDAVSEPAPTPAPTSAEEPASQPASPPSAPEAATPAAETAPAAAPSPAPEPAAPTATPAAVPEAATAPATPAPAAPVPPTTPAKPTSDLGLIFVGPAILFVIMLVLLYLHQTGW